MNDSLQMPLNGFAFQLRREALHNEGEYQASMAKAVAPAANTR